jgi:hypothetical protein
LEFRNAFPESASQGAAKKDLSSLAMEKLRHEFEVSYVGVVTVG